MKSDEQKIKESVCLLDKINDLLSEYDSDVATATMISCMVQAACRSDVSRRKFLEDLGAYWDKYMEYKNAI